MQNDVSIDLFTCQIVKPYPLPSLYHNCTMFQLATIINNTSNFQWLTIKNNVSYTIEHYQYNNMDSMYGVTCPLNLGSIWMLTLEKEVVATCIAKTLVASCNIFFKHTRPKPKHRALILFGLFLMWTFHFFFNFLFLHLLLQYVALIIFVYGVLERCFEGRCLGMAKHAINWKEKTREK